MSALDFIFQLPFSWRQRRAMETRTAITRDAFVNAAARTPFEAEVAAEVWQRLRHEAVTDDFRPLPSDNLGELYGIAEEELDEDLILSLISQFGVRVPHQNVIDAFGPVETAEDVVRFISYLRDGLSCRVDHAEINGA